MSSAIRDGSTIDERAIISKVREPDLGGFGEMRSNAAFVYTSLQASS
jgi:hypothetical protein